MDIHNDSDWPSGLIRRKGDHMKRPVTLRSCLQLLEILRANRDELSRVSHEPSRQPNSKATERREINRLQREAVSEKHSLPFGRSVCS